VLHEILDQLAIVLLKGIMLSSTVIIMVANALRCAAQRQPQYNAGLTVKNPAQRVGTNDIVGRPDAFDPFITCCFLALQPRIDRAIEVFRDVESSCRVFASPFVMAGFRSLW
jgi:hypothetical protein